MIRALLAGTKTQTRRVLKQANGPSLSVRMDDEAPGVAELSWLWGDGPGYDVNEAIKRVSCPYGQPGDRLRVKEAAWMWCERQPNGTTKTGRQKWLYAPMRGAGIWYAADHRTKPTINVVSPDTGNRWGWRLKIGRFLPLWASRILLEVTAVRVERLQEIIETDAIAEGTYSYATQLAEDPAVSAADIEDLIGKYGEGRVRCLYAALWESINGPGSWDANPWVWVVEFRRVTP